MADRDDDLFEELRSKLPGVLFVKCDVSSEDQVRDAIQRAIENFGTIHVALCCAGIAVLTPTLTS